MRKWKNSILVVIDTKDRVKVNTLFRIYFEVLLLDQCDLRAVLLMTASGVDALWCVT